jgi:ankyrin repeat protein
MNNGMKVDIMYYDRSLLSMASQYGHTEIIRVLQRYPGWDVQSSEAFIHASANGHLTIVRLILTAIPTDNKFTSNHDNEGHTALTRASKAGYVAIVRLLLKWQCDPGVDTRSGQTALILASAAGHAGVVRLLLETGKSKPGQETLSGQTALILAASNDHLEVVKLLLRSGESNPECVDNYGESAHSCALSNGNDDVAKYIRQYLVSQKVVQEVNRRRTIQSTVLATWIRVAKTRIINTKNTQSQKHTIGQGWRKRLNFEKQNGTTGELFKRTDDSINSKFKDYDVFNFNEWILAQHQDYSKRHYGNSTGYDPSWGPMPTVLNK